MSSTFTSQRLRRLLRELQRRRVFRTAAGYSAVAFVVAQAAALVVPALLLPEWTLRALVVALLLGFPIAVTLAWAFDLSPVREGPGEEARMEEPDTTASAGTSTGRHLRSFALSLVAVGLLAAVGATVFDGWRVLGSDVAEEGPRSLAVLPFADLSPEGNREYLSYGIAAEILTSLSTLPGIDVVGRSSSFQFKEVDPDVREVGRSLGVEAVLEGSVRSDGDRIRVAVQLTDARTGYDLWSASYDRTLTDIFALQEEVARSVVESLPIRDAVTVGIPEPPRTDPDTYRLYLRGRYSWNKRTPESLQRADELFSLAIARDSAFAPAYAGRADALVALGSMGVVPRAKAVVEARDLARRAVDLAPRSADARTALAQALEALGDRANAERAYRTALDLNQGHATARHWYALLLTSMGRHAEALRHAEQAGRLDPLSLPARISHGVVLLGAGRSEEAGGHFEELLEEEPGAWSALPYLSLAHSLEGRHREAVDVARRAVEARPDLPDLQAFEVHALARGGRTSDAEQALDRLRRAGGTAGALAVAHASLGHRDSAFSALDRALAERSEQIFYLLVDPRFDPIRDDPRFARVLEAEGLPEAGTPLQSDRSRTFP